MPNLREWIEAQLKRGHKKEEIKRYLRNRSYPESAVIKVDKIKISDNEKFYANQKHFQHRHR